MASYTWNGNQSGHTGDIGYAANFSPGSGPPAAGDSVYDAYGSVGASSGTSAASWFLSNCNIGGGTFSGSVSTSKNVTGGTFSGSLTVSSGGYLYSTGVTLTNCTSLTIDGVTFKPHASSFGLTAGNLLYGQTVDDVVGTLHEAATTDVRHGTQYGAGGTAHTGSAYIPAAAAVRHGVSVDATTGTCWVPGASVVLTGNAIDATTGTLVLPATLDVLYPTNYGVGGSAQQGILTLPNSGSAPYNADPGLISNTAKWGAVGSLLSGTRTDCPAAQALTSASYGYPANPTAGTVSEATITDVRHGTQYGAGGNAHTGSAYIPAAGDVRHGVNVGATAGTAYIPAAADVRNGTNVDGTTGTLVSTDPGQACVLSGVSYEINSASKTGTLAFLTPQDVADAMKLAPTSGQPAAGSVMDRLADRTGYKLAPDGLDAVDMTTPTGPAANFRQMLVQLWRRFFKKAILDHGAGTLVTYADDGVSVLTTQVASETDQVETQGPAT
jgi:hypothetical protein